MKTIKSDYEELTKEGMNELLLGLGESTYFRAIIQYCNEQLEIIKDSNMNFDPFREPTNLARNQGFGMGLQSLPQYIASLQQKARKNEAAAPE